MKVFTLTLVTVLLIGASSGAVKVRRSEKHPSLTEETKPNEDVKTDVKTDVLEAVVDNKEKEVHKRGILHYGHGFSGHGGNVWPKTYASHYGYGLHLPAAHAHAPTALRYNSGLHHYKSFAAPSIFSGVSTLSGALPTFASVGPTVSFGHQGAAAVAAAQPFIIRPGGAVVQSYSVNYPQHKPAVAVKPVHSFASVAPVQHLHPVQSVQTAHSFASVAPVQHLHPVQSVQTAHSFASVAPVQHLHPVQAVQPVQPHIHTFQTVQNVQPVHAVQPIQPVHSFQSVQPVHHIQPVQPVQPVQSVVQVQHFKPPVNYDITQQFPSYFQTSFVQEPAQVPNIPQAPSVAFTPAQPAFPDIPQFPNPPAFPAIPAVPTLPAAPALPALPAAPAFPSFPSILNFPPAQSPTNGFFPVSVQPPLPQQPPPFVSFNPAAQFPGFGPIAGTPNHNNPEVGSAEASPQIPVQPAAAIPEPELPSPQPQPTQQPWKPVYHQTPTAESPLDRPSHTLLPPYGNSPAEGYLPPAPSSHGQKVQQEYTIDSQLFDNLSDADIQNIFAQANLAAQNDHHHHTVHNYHSSHY